MSNTEYSDLILAFLTMSNQIKLYHWQTKIHPRHVSTDNYFSQINKLIDQFIETLMGRSIIEKKDLNYRILVKSSNKIKLENYDDANAFDFISNIKSYLESEIINNVINNSTDLGNIRDEMLGVTNQLGYLFSLN
jgi:hypothetical protein